MNKIFNLKNRIAPVLFIVLFFTSLLGVNVASVYGNTNAPLVPNSPPGVSTLQDPLGGTNVKGSGDKINPLIKKIIDTALGVLGSVTLLVFVAGGLMWLTSGGNEQKVDKGTKTMLYATIGIFVIFSAYAVLSTLIKVLTNG
ncbi:MAG: hypothetical protein A2224_01135 [Candidatus Magasanikbacteria bacterium RIFOXYA2_FULL_40_20]|nr:MAG: hypothetical protein A2224_01135 [Candidatus Magasanikbacteria bacterium RIFOXYA2_FULL_40_20]